MTADATAQRTHDPSGGDVVARFEIRLRRVLDSEGRPVGAPPAADPAHLIALYRAMVRARTFDTKAIALQRTGRLGTYPPCLGEEAVGVGLAAAMEPEDVLLPTYREQAAQLWRGVTPVELLLYWGGDERGSDFAGPRRDFPVCVPVASHAPHAAGVALAISIRGERRVAVCVLGDGATSKGDFWEALNIAGAMRLPALFVVANNEWAISVPRARQTAARTLAQKAIAAGIPGEQVDGNDVIAVADATRAALERARAAEGPALIEALTYRLGDHTTVDDARRYRDDADVSPHWDAEPLRRMRAYLTEAGHWDAHDEQRLLADCAAEIDAAAQSYLAIEPLPPESMFDHLYARAPAEIAEQRRALIEARRRG